MPPSPELIASLGAAARAAFGTSTSELGPGLQLGHQVAARTSRCTAFLRGLGSSELRGARGVREQ